MRAATRERMTKARMMTERMIRIMARGRVDCRQTGSNRIEWISRGTRSTTRSGDGFEARSPFQAFANGGLDRWEGRMSNCCWQD